MLFQEMIRDRYANATASRWPTAHVLIASGDPQRATALRDALLRKHYVVAIARDASTALRHLHMGSADLLLADLDDPALDGVDLCRRARAGGLKIPVLMLHAAGTLDTLLDGFEAGADAYLRGWYSHAEVLGQLGALTRRMAVQGEDQ